MGNRESNSLPKLRGGLVKEREGKEKRDEPKSAPFVRKGLRSY